MHMHMHVRDMCMYMCMYMRMQVRDNLPGFRAAATAGLYVNVYTLPSHIYIHIYAKGLFPPGRCRPGGAPRAPLFPLARRLVARLGCTGREPTLVVVHARGL